MRTKFGILDNANVYASRSTQPIQKHVQIWEDIPGTNTLDT